MVTGLLQNHDHGSLSAASPTPRPVDFQQHFTSTEGTPMQFPALAPLRRALTLECLFLVLFPALLPAQSLNGYFNSYMVDWYALRETHSPRQIGMGKIDAVVSGEPSAMLNNPAALGLFPSDNRSAAAGYTFHRLLPVLKIRESWQQRAYASFSPSPAIGNFGFTYATTSTGLYNGCNDMNILDSLEFWGGFNSDDPFLEECDTVICNANGDNCECGYRPIECRNNKRYREYRLLLALSYGRAFTTGTLLRHSIGVSVKHYRYNVALQGSYQLPVTFDVGYQLTGPAGISYGLTAANIGPELSWSAESRYFDEKYDSTIVDKSSGTVAAPFIVTTGLQYDMQEILTKVPWLDITLAASLRAMFLSYESMPFYRLVRTEEKSESPWEYSFGTEVSLFNRVFLRFGTHFDTHDDRYSWGDDTFEYREINWGIGIHPVDHVNLAYYVNHLMISDEDVLNWGISLELTGLFSGK